MFEWAGLAMDTLWHNGLAAIPLVIVAAAASRFLPCLPATRHLIWVTVLIWLVGSSLLPQVPVSLIGNPASDHSASDGVANNPKAADKNSETKVSSDKPKPRRLTSRLAKQEASKRAAEASSASTLSPLSPASTRPNGDATSGKNLSSQTTPPPRYAARAEIPAPDKLARAQGAAGPRSLMAFDKKEPIKFETSRYPGAYFKTFSFSNQQSESHEKLNIAPTVQLDLSPPTRTESLAGNSIPRDLPKRESTLTEQASLQAAFNASRPRQEVESRPWDQWSSAVLGVRDAVSQLPPLPRNVWLGGTALLLVLAAVRVLSFRRKLRHARPAPREVQTVVESACASLGLRRVPQILMVDGRLSPMVWCGVTPKLILPTRLWEQLDELGRKAVVFHELAHIRRLDHRTAWVESAIGMLYWWHPLVWWVRARLHAEAENCCDAWVMTLLPKTRRAYATALLKTREYLSGGGDTVPAMGIGITPGRARLFARRLTMIMTESVRPRLSFTGISLVMLVTVCGWVASPARSCPEEDAVDASKAAKAPCASAKSHDGATSAPCAKEQSTPLPKAKFEKPLTGRGPSGVLVSQPIPTPSAQAGTVVVVPVSDKAPVAGIVQVSDRDPGRARRVAELQAELARLEQRIESLTDALDEQEDAEEAEDDDEAEHGHAHGLGHGDAGEDDDDDDDAPRADRAPRAPHSPMPPRAGQPAMAPMPPLPPMPPMTPPSGAHGRGPGFAPMAMPKPGQSWADVSGEETTWLTYKLSKGKAEDFFKFMSRSDIPIWVRANDEGIDIQASPRQHEIFDEFFRIVDPSQDRAPRAGMFQQNGPMLAFATGMGAGCGGGCAKGCGNNCSRCMQASELRVMANEMKTRAYAEALELRAKARGDGERVRAQAREEAEKARARMRRHARDARGEARDQHEMIEGLERQSQQLAEAADSYREQAERISERAQSVNERVQQDDEIAASADAYRMHVESLERSAEELNRQAEQLQREAETIEQRAREVEENAREMEEHAEDLDQRAEAVREAVETLETGVQPTPELVESVLALVSGIEQMIPVAAKEAIEDAVSAVSEGPVIAVEGKPIVIELEEIPSDDPTIAEPDSDEQN